MVHKIPNFASFDPKLWYNVSQMNKVNLRYVVCVVFCVFMVFWVACRWRPDRRRKEGTRHAALSADRAERLLDFVHFIPLPRAPRHPASDKWKPPGFVRSWSHIMSEDRCQKSLSLLGSNDLKYRREFSHSMPKRHRHRMSKKWSIITAVIKFELMTKRQNCYLAFASFACIGFYSQPRLPRQGGVLLSSDLLALHCNPKG